MIAQSVGSVLSDPSVNHKKRLDLAKEKLLKIRDSILDLKLIFVELDNEDDAYIIFETLNTRGKDLSLADLVKNHITKNLKTKSASVDQVKIKWENILETIQGSAFDLDVDSFLHHSWQSKYEYVPAKKLFKVLKKEVTKQLSSEFLDFLVSDSKIYRSIHEIDYGKWSKQERKIKESLQALMLFRVRQQTPCVLSLVRDYRNKKIKKKHLEDALIAIEKFHFLFTAVTSQRSSGGISGMYASLGRRISDAKDAESSVEIIRELKMKLKERVPSLEEVKALFPQIIYTYEHTKQRKLAKYILSEFHKYNNKDNKTDYDKMTIEHLVPQSMIGTSGYTNEDIGQIGNLMLVSEDINGKLKDKHFKDKMDILTENKYQIDVDMAEKDEWLIEDINKRSRSLAEVAFSKIWKI